MFPNQPCPAYFNVSIMVNISIANVFMVDKIKGSRSRVTMKTVINLGTKVRVCSEIEVAAWNIEMVRPTIRDARSRGPTTSITV